MNYTKIKRAGRTSVSSLFLVVSLLAMIAAIILAVRVLVRSSGTFLVLLLLVGCSRSMKYEVTTTRPDGTVIRESFDYRNDGFDTKAGKIDIQKDGAKVGVTLDNLDSQARAMDLANAAIGIVGTSVKAVK